MATYSAGTAFLTVVPSFKGIEDAFKKQVADMAAKADKDLAAGVARGLREAQKQARGAGAQAGKDYAGAYEREAAKTLTKAWQQLPAPQPDVNLSKWDKALDTVRQDMKELSEQRIGIDIDRATFDRAIADFHTRLQALRDSTSGLNKEIQFFNADRAARELEALSNFTRDAGRLSADGGQLAGSAFGERMTAAVRNALSKIPAVKVDGDTSDAERKLADLRARLVDLQDQHIGVDIDAAAAYATLRAIQSQLQDLDNQDVQVDVRTNAHEAAAGMTQFIQQAEQASRSVDSIGHRANFSMSRLEYLIALGASLGTTIVPAAAAAAGAIGMLGTAAIAAVTGLGVFALGLSGVGEAVKALNQYQQDQAKSSNSLVQANDRISSSTDQVRMAQLALANTRRNVAEAAADAARRVEDAERGVAQARRAAALEARDSARVVAEARDRVREAEEDLAEARRQSRIDLAEADRQVQSAQRAVTEAERDALDVRKDLTEAIDDARRSMEELNVEIGRNELDQQKAVTAQMAALEELNKLKMNPRATEVELRRAQDAYDEQTQRIRELQQDHKELAADKKKYDEQGVEADERVIAARKRIAEADQKVADAQARLAREQEQRREVEYRAQERIADAQDRVAKAQESVSRAQEQQREQAIRSQEKIADAERRVADARRDQARQARDGQYQIQQATAAVTSAQRAQAKAWRDSGTAGGAALDKLNQKMGDISPTAQHFARFIFGLKDEWQGLRDAAAEPLLPRLEEAITGLLPYLPAVRDFVGDIATALGDMAIAAVDALGNPVWQRFFAYIDRTAVPSLHTMFETGMNLTEGLISLFMALTPFNEPVGTGLVELSRDFAEWAERLNKTQGYQEFLQYVQENGPRVVHFLGELGHLFIRLVEAAAPVGAVVLRVMTALIDVLNSIPDEALTALVVGIAAVSIGFTALGAVMRVVKLREQLNDIFGNRTQDMVQRYAYETGRATTETGRLATANAVLGGMATNARDRVASAASAIGSIPSRMQAATTGTSALGRAMDTLRTTAGNAVLALNGPGGIAGAAQAAGGRVAAMASQAGSAASGGLARLRTAVMDIAAATNGPAGMAAGVQNAGGRLAGLARGAGTAATSLGTKLMNGLSAVSGFVGGPFNLALLGGTAAIATLASASAEYNGKIDTLVTTLNQLGREYKEMADAGKLGTPDAKAILEEIANQNPEMAAAVKNLDSIGISIGQLGNAAAGSQQQLSDILASLDEEIDATEAKWKDQSNFLLTVWSDDARATSDRLAQLRQLRDALGEHADKARLASEVQAVLNKEDERAAVLLAAKRSGQVMSLTAEQNLLTAYDNNAAAIKVLNGFITTMSDSQSTAKQKADALRAAIEHQTSSVITATEADEAFNAKLITLRETINSAKAAGDKHSTSLALNTAQGLKNRDALEDVAGAIRDQYLADIESGTPMDKALRRHNDRIKALKEEAAKLGLTKTETNKLIDAYGGIPKNVETTLKTNNFDEVYKDLQRMQFMQSMLKIGMDPKSAEREWQDYQREVGRALTRADGGPIHGPGTKTSDSVLTWTSDGEWVHKAAAVDYYGDRTMSAINNMQIPKETLDGYATGGKVSLNPVPKVTGLPKFAAGGRVNKQIWPMVIDLSKTWVPDKDWVYESAEGGGTLGGVAGGRGWQWQMSVLRKRFPGLALYSGYRGGSITSSGNRSWHGIDGGRAVDIPPRQDVFNFIHGTYGKGTKELIWGGDPNRNIHNGKHHRFSESLLRAHGPYKGVRGPSPHVHWAYDEGGELPPGFSTIYNGTGRPEAVLTNQQWQDISALARAAKAAAVSGNAYHFQFRDTTLDMAQLRALQDREAVLARDDRSW